MLLKVGTKLTEQEEFWRGNFGTEYTDRNEGQKLEASNVSLFAKIFAHVDGIESVLEVGANRGLNLSAMSRLFPNQERDGIEINAAAAERLRGNTAVNDVFEGSANSVVINKQYDLVLCKGVLIHLNPSALPECYARFSKWSKKYVLFAEYYSPSPTKIDYRGHSDKLFKRDFAGEFLEICPEFKLKDYGFAYHRDMNFPQDDLNWFLMERR